MFKNDFRPRNWIESLNCAIEGIIYAVKTQRHMRYHFAFVILALTLGILLDLPLIEFVLFLLAFTLLLFAEMLNTAVEVTVDMVTKDYHPMAKVAKDIAAGGVLISSFGVILMGYIIFTEHLSEPLGSTLGTIKGLTGYLSLFSLMVVLFGVVISKAHFGRGTPLRGGIPSGHSAVAFSLWISISLITLDPLITILTLILALMVSHSRLIAGIHSKLEIFLGAMLGMAITSLAFFLLS